MFEKYFKMKEKNSIKLVNQYEEYTQGPRKIKEELMDAFIKKWGVILPLVHDWGYEQVTLVGYRVPLSLETPDWAMRMEFIENGEKTAFWKPNTSTEKGLEFDADLKIINDQLVTDFNPYVTTRFLGTDTNIIDEQGNTHIPVAGPDPTGDMIIMRVPVPTADSKVVFNELGFIEIEQAEFVSMITAS